MDHWEQEALADPEVREALDGALHAAPEDLVSRESFAAYAEEPPEGQGQGASGRRANEER